MIDNIFLKQWYLNTKTSTTIINIFKFMIHIYEYYKIVKKLLETFILAITYIHVLHALFQHISILNSFFFFKGIKSKYSLEKQTWNYFENTAFQWTLIKGDGWWICKILNYRVELLIKMW